MTQEQLEQQLNAAKAERDSFIQQINQELLFRNGRIDMLEELLRAMTAPVPEE